MTDSQLQRTLDTLAEQIHDCVQENEGRLWWLKITAPAGQQKGVEEALPALLTKMGLDFIDVHVEASDATPQILEARFDDGWS
jgi:hypothetical protein